MGGRGLTDKNRLHDKQLKLLQSYFLNKQATSPLHAAVVNVDDRYTLLDLFRSDENELVTDEEYNNKGKRQWFQKALHGRHPYELNQQYVDVRRSIEQMADKRGSVRRNRGLFNSNTGPSRTKKKLQEAYFEAARHR